MDIAQSLISAASGLGGVFLGGWLTFRNAGKEKLIDLRRATYGEILFELSELEKVFDIAADYISQGGWDTYIGSDVSKKHSDQISEHLAKIEKRLSGDYLVISDQFRSLYEVFVTERRTSDDIAYYEEDDTFELALKKHRPLLLAQARKEVAR